MTPCSLVGIYWHFWWRYWVYRQGQSTNEATNQRAWSRENHHCDKAIRSSETSANFHKATQCLTLYYTGTIRINIKLTAQLSMNRLWQACISERRFGGGARRRSILLFNFIFSLIQNNNILQCRLYLTFEVFITANIHFFHLDVTLSRNGKKVSSFRRNLLPLLQDIFSSFYWITDIEVAVTSTSRIK
jgi:hypothetical protein